MMGTRRLLNSTAHLGLMSSKATGHHPSIFDRAGPEPAEAFWKLVVTVGQMIDIAIELLKKSQSFGLLKMVIVCAAGW
jgi:hypothetical protein